ncbi:hypothetical protein AB0E96_18300 [Kitasatospora sp. NPDC036755]|uniref:hypothetical protein n=1 Tax=Kitasatospora sp. NPDC036755 TaxID=3154600 RepID=UPI0033DD241F
MEDIGPPAGGPADDAETLDLCDHCGRAVARAELLGALVPDSSVLHSAEPELDGRRVVLACCADHLAALVADYRRRPFVPEEQ